ncbi:MAG: rhodanese-like domain-containing protein [Flavobacteriia bacterium]|nr:rhodanese-like domain-containing protein [Flavobacteriia bacterium]OIP47017.1 MAG: sulfurtransferase [Flavobacteriaceae bacterium CG2_30_31_66]PIV96615.1 MAG: sulfurtransferase [Flavobacteriaceae bacterium CG17_big_fil_post_rev_8_21_14_2_50_31_13]PIX13978.1 MAG: sulfurtransferase [Flavobacteriaceae bacterium CG_4_8_14_3_um_filter_31_8]PIY13902.1 MAG: sulfurtransferase [Flavobacteriaceae bacterium CG_4_10_14_3_um_filter_31_253]PIZ10603.1 MAG: sulfurtransferase [Flavobacteriaceae bacterium CG
MSAEIKEYLGKNAVILDVRTQEEWNEGHSKGAKHVVLNLVPVKIDEIKSWKKPIIAVCRSGARSGQATQFLKQNGVDVINGGPWQNVDQYLGK